MDYYKRKYSKYKALYYALKGEYENMVLTTCRYRDHCRQLDRVRKNLEFPNDIRHVILYHWNDLDALELAEKKAAMNRNHPLLRDLVD